MVIKFFSFATALLLVFPTAVYPQTATTDPAPQSPDFKIEVWGYVVHDFSLRMSSYFELRQKLEEGLPALVVTDDPRRIRAAERALAKRIRIARAGAHYGDIFDSTISGAFRAALILETTATTCASIMDDNPGEFSLRINGTYPKSKPLSTVPPGVLSRLPKLPDDVYYRFLGRHLILHDMRANVILDELPDAIRCPELDD